MCDCCDGSDEPIGVCDHTCLEQSEATVVELREKVAHISEALLKAAASVEEAKADRANWPTRHQDLVAELLEKEAALVRAEEEKAQAEAQSKEASEAQSKMLQERNERRKQEEERRMLAEQAAGTDANADAGASDGSEQVCLPTEVVCSSVMFLLLCVCIICVFVESASLQPHTACASHTRVWCCRRLCVYVCSTHVAVFQG